MHLYLQARDCPNNPPVQRDFGGPSNNNGGAVCYTCGKPGHISRNCTEAGANANPAFGGRSNDAAFGARKTGNVRNLVGFCVLWLSHLAYFLFASLVANCCRVSRRSSSRSLTFSPHSSLSLFRCSFTSRPHASLARLVTTLISLDPHTQSKCYNCGQFGHISKDCTEPRNRQVCYKCNGEGHISRDCPTAAAAPAQA